MHGPAVAFSCARRSRSCSAANKAKNDWRWAAHVVEVETGLPPDAPAGSRPRPGFDPAVHTLAEREEAKAAELTAAGEPTSVVTVRRMLRRYAETGVFGLVDQRRLRPKHTTGRTDPRVVAAIARVLEGETHDSTGTRDRFARRVRACLDAEHGPSTVT